MVENEQTFSEKPPSKMDIVKKFEVKKPLQHLIFPGKIFPSVVSEQILPHFLIIEKFSSQSYFFRLRHFPAQCLRSFHSKQREKQQAPDKTGRF